MSLGAKIAFGVLLIAALTITYSWEPGQTELTPPEQRKPAPDFTLADSIGKPVRLSDYQGQVVLLNFWATWCPPCRIEIPWFVEFEREYKTQGLVVIGVSLDEDRWKAVTPFMHDQGMNYRVAVAGPGELPLFYDRIELLPTTFLIDRDGKIAATHNRLVSRATYEDAIVELLKK